MQRGSFQWMKSLNKSIILNKVRTNGPISRAQIAKDTKLTPPTVGTIIKELIEQGIVKESNLGVSQGGRKPTMLVINNSEFYIVGVDAGPSNIEVILSDLTGNILSKSTSLIGNVSSNEQFLGILKGAITELMDEFYYLKEKIIGIGVAMHGVVEVKSGTSLFATNLNLQDIPIRQELEEAFDLVVKVENDARAYALAEAWFGQNDSIGSMLAINIGRGIGAGMIIDGKLYHGEHGIAGEIGHMTLDMNGKKCQCGNRGCLQTVASGPAMVEKARLAITTNKSLLTEMIADGHELTGELVFQAAQKGDALAKRILEETGTFIGVGLTNLIHVFNPTKIVVGGGVAKAGSFILDPIKSAIEERVLTTTAKQTEVVLTDLGENSTAIGAVALLLVELFQPVTIR
ncbi:ROK family protein [Aquibacillus halophilus]|uniref:ROK family protein n=1 Tax=Aquibacillus halophilus TaxID=930132 RepID=A0A6A8DET9_9BACI|nr:ROK family transcriptional regulator [Aquibacillus halophilus]MRH44218.1 ROK family protein [Aquibacillus halophilus]